MICRVQALLLWNHVVSRTDVVSRSSGVKRQHKVEMAVIIQVSNAFLSLLACGLEPNDKTVLFIQSDVVYRWDCDS